MVQLTAFLTVEHATGSTRAGGFAVAAFGLGAAAAPFRGRLIDRKGAKPWLPIMAICFAASMIALAVLAHAGAPSWLLLSAVGVSGLVIPPVFSSARAAWGRTVEKRLVRRGYAMSSLVLDVGLVAGPALAGALILAWDWLPAIVCAAAALTGALTFVSTPGAAAPETPTPMPSLRASRALRGFLVVCIAFGAAQGAIQVGVPAAAKEWGYGDLAGPLLAAFAAGSVIGALWFGARHWTRAPLLRYLLAAIALGLLILPAALVTHPAPLAPILLVAGLAYGPATVSVFETLDALLPGSGTEALSWVTTAEAAGAAGGAGVAGVLATSSGVGFVFVLAAALAVIPAAAALLLARPGHSTIRA